MMGDRQVLVFGLLFAGLALGCDAPDSTPLPVVAAEESPEEGLETPTETERDVEPEAPARDPLVSEEPWRSAEDESGNGESETETWNGRDGTAEVIEPGEEGEIFMEYDSFQMILWGEIAVNNTLWTEGFGGIELVGLSDAEGVELCVVEFDFIPSPNSPPLCELCTQVYMLEIQATLEKNNVNGLCQEFELSAAALNGSVNPVGFGAEEGFYFWNEDGGEWLGPLGEVLPSDGDSALFFEGVLFEF